MRLIAILTVLALLVPGCIGSKPAAPTRFYLLTPETYAAPLAAPAGPEAGRVVEIRSLELPQYLERPQMVTRKTGNQLDMAEYHQWAGNLRKNMIRVLTQNLGFLLSTPQVYSPPYHGQADPDFRINVQVMAFEAGPLDKVVLTVQWQMTQGKTRQLVASELSTFEQPVKGGGMEDVAAAMSRALGDFCLTLARAAEDMRQ